MDLDFLRLLSQHVISLTPWRPDRASVGVDISSVEELFVLIVAEATFL